MKLFHKRIRRIEEKIAAPVKASGLKLPPVILRTILVETRPESSEGHPVPTTEEDSRFARVDEKTWNRDPAESWQEFSKRVESQLPPLKPDFFAWDVTYSVSRES
jgi:hypothetical protein